MDNTNIILRIIDQLIEKEYKIYEIAKIQKISVEEVWESILLLYNSGLDKKFEIEVYYKDKLIEDIPDMDIYTLYDYEMIKEFEVLLFYKDKQINYINRLSYDERWLLYDLLNTCNDSFVEEIKAKINNVYDLEYKDSFTKLNERRIIKKNISIFNNIDSVLLTNIYKAIDSKLALDIYINDNIRINAVSPINIYYDDDLEEWYLQYVRKRKINIIKLNKIKNTTISLHPYCYKKPLINKWGIGNETDVTILLYDEKNAKDVRSRFLIRKDIMKIEKLSDCIKIKIKIYDINLFKRWVRGMGPQVIVLEPKWLRQEILKEVNDWINILEN